MRGTRGMREKNRMQIIFSIFRILIFGFSNLNLAPGRAPTYHVSEMYLCACMGFFWKSLGFAFGSQKYIKKYLLKQNLEV
ncbi:hypothetical protein BAQ44_22315 [Bacillus mobilis]|nr:hypothetical protein BAQ44_22315 [Bacillus mobilis]